MKAAQSGEPDVADATLDDATWPVAPRCNIRNIMAGSIQAYQQLIDRLADSARNCVVAHWVREGVWRSPQEKYQRFLDSLSGDQRETLSQMLEHAYRGGFHDCLAAMTDLGLGFELDGTRLAHEPTGSPSCFDLVCRIEGDPWPNDLSDTDDSRDV